ncbi:MAG: NAD(P)H-hydrate dehydratase [Microbacteriaceae bacterium]|nr:NAD(P)H-hydrate dehydratase [Microbacteriaceae bacterium]MCL2794616.1 NAD(P)H-hydrate dehydratase [Microbacteriaceae bacterium]
MTGVRVWEPVDAARMLRAPGPDDNKYTRGVVGIATGSERYPGAAVLGVEGAMRTGVGMVRFLGSPMPTRLVLQRRPEVVVGGGRVEAWVVGSGLPPASERSQEDMSHMATALVSGAPLVVDAGALDRLMAAAGPAVITPHHAELARTLADTQAPLSIDEIKGDAAAAASRAADLLGVTVLLKGHTTHVAAPGGGAPIAVTLGTPWLATAGSGDVLSGILGALIAGHADDVTARGHEALAELAATAAALHGLAGVKASGGGPITALEVARAVPGVVAALLQTRR